MRVVGTAGHVDHGKSALVEALTGTHPDRLKEEQEREMTIDLGFAWATLPGGGEIGFVDVPGHRDFIENMLAGVAGIDAVLFVVAADEGVMPQTREHLAILDILQIPAGVIALTKVDLVGDPDWLDLVEGDLRQLLSPTLLADAPIVRVSAQTGERLETLRSTLSDVLSGRPQRQDLARPRLPIDRVFTIAGFGTVVTGTLSDGHFGVGDEIEVLPQGLRGRIRGLQSHKRKTDKAVPGSRTAVNVGGIDHDLISRGDVLVHPGTIRPTRRLDVRFHLLPNASLPLKHNTEVKLFIGASETVARVRLLGVREINPGEVGWLQLEPREPVVTARGDRYILRRPSPGETLGGGEVLDAHPKSRSRRFDEEVLARLEALTGGSYRGVFLQAVLAAGAAPLDELLANNSLDREAALAALDVLSTDGEVLVIGAGKDDPNPLIAHREYWQALVSKTLDAVSSFHERQPLRRAMSREELRSKLNVPERILAAVLHQAAAGNSLVEEGALVFRPGYAINFSPAQEKAVGELLVQFDKKPYTPPTVRECLDAVGEDVYQAMLDVGMLVQVSTEVVFRQEHYAGMVAEVRGLIKGQGSVNVGLVRDHFNTTRRYALALLEHLDAEGLTVREGDERRLK